MNLAIRGKAKRQGFSLIEVVLAIGIVSFSMLAILGVLPVGIQMVQDSMLQQAKASITNQLRSKMQQISFDTSSDFNINTLTTANFYYTREGIETLSTSKDAYFTVSFDLQTAGIEEAGGGSANFDQTIARNVHVTMSYPKAAPSPNQRKLYFALFSAKQKNF